MSETGKAYLPTRWEHGERPVTAAKLNAWDDHIAAALTLAYRLINVVAGGGDGVLAGSLDGVLVTAHMPASLSVRVLPGHAFIGNMPFELAEAVDLPPATPPESLPRIDLVQARLSDWSLTVTTGTEAESPDAPEADEDCLPLARLHLRPGMTAIKAEDDGINGYIEDTRTLL